MYVGTYLDSRNNLLYVNERINGQRTITSYPLILEYYVPDNDGYYMGYDDVRLKKITLKSYNEYRNHKISCKESNIKTYELNFNLINKVLYKQYKGCPSPELHKSYIDIEVDRKGFEYLTVKQLVDEACCPINAISIYNDWMNILFTFMLKPETLSNEEAQTICNKFENTFLFNDEKDLLKAIIAVLEDTDVATGWNFSFFDTPYIVRRITNVLGEEETSKLCLFNQKPNLKEKVNKFNDKNITYEIPGKWFVDYMELYIKHEQGRKESYSLNSIAEIELKEQKVQHDESLEDMYRQRYEDFIKYNRQDTMLVYRIDKKKNYINLHNAQAHDICCSLDQTMGTVGWVDQAIINEAHNNNLLVPDRIEGKNSEFDGVVPPGAYCAEPIVKGLVSDIFSFDMNSLYPTTIRTLNLSPETIFGQVELSLTLPYLWNRIRTEKLWKNVSKQIPNWGAAWGGLWSVLEYDEIMKQSDTVLTLKLESGERVDLTAKEIYGLVFNDDNNLCISATGTIYRTDKQGLIASVLGKWYSERKKLKKELFKYETMASGFIVDDADLLNLLKSTKITYKENETKEYDFEKIKELLNVDKFDELIEFMSENHLYLNDNNVIVSEYQEYFEERQAYYDLAQYVKKIQLNSSYGALLNSASTFYDFRMGSSTTMSGRKVVQHLTSKANELLCGVYADKGYCAEYNDTDSVYCYINNDYFKKAHPDFEFTKENIIAFSNDVADKINDSFPEHLMKIFHCNEERASLQKAAKEVVASRGIFVSKKRYALLVYEHDGYRKDIGDIGEMKIMGLQVKRSDCPQLVRNMLKDMLKSLLQYGSKDKLIDILKEFGENKWKLLKPWEKGTPNACNKLTYYTEQYIATKKCSVGQVMASINWNMLIDIYKDNRTPKILDGNKIIVCKLKPNNAFNMNSVAFPVDLDIFPEWFKSLPFDEQSMKDSVVDTTIDTIFGVLGWKLSLESALNKVDDLDGFLTFV